MGTGVWHFGGSQREIPYRRLLRESDITGAGVPQLRPVPALHRGREEVSRARIPSTICPFFLWRTSTLDLCVWPRLQQACKRAGGRKRFVSRFIFTQTTNTSGQSPKNTNLSISTAVSRRCVSVGSFTALLLLLCVEKVKIRIMTIPSKEL